ncbi:MULTISPECIES: VOC family protein [unclassified Streptomyces]|uniref:VOC family protein n=1 Tax=unclassified Streptomyces TaxID=2593676 RepID=UPI00382A952B
MTDNDTTPHPAPVMRRRSNDSSALASPRAFVRVFTGPGTLEELTVFYEEVLGIERDMWFTYPAKGIALAAVGGFLLIEGSDEAVAPFLDADGTLLVDSAEDHLARLTARGAEILDPLHPVPTGSGFTARHPDGTVIEYVEHRPTPEGL